MTEYFAYLAGISSLPMQPGTPYTESGKYSLPRTILAILIGIFAGNLLGHIRTIISSPDAGVKISVIFFIINVVGLVWVSGKLLTFAKSRNRVVSGIIVSVMCYAAWTAGWEIKRSTGGLHLPLAIDPLHLLHAIANRISDLTEYGVDSIIFLIIYNPVVLTIAYIAELLIFAAIAWIGFRSIPFCEECQTFHTQHKLYSADAVGVKDRLNNDNTNHPLDFLGTETYYIHNENDPSVKNDSAVEVNLYSCKCNRHALVDITSYAVRNKDKKPAKLVGKEVLRDKVYISEKTANALAQHIPVKQKAKTLA